MHPILSDIRKLVSYIGAWLLIGMLIAKSITLAGIAVWSTALFFSLPVVLIYGFIASSAFYVCRALPFSGRRFLPTVTVFFFTSALSGGIWLLLCSGWNELATGMGWWSIRFSQNSESLLYFAGCISYLISLLLHDVLIAADRLRDAELQASKSEVQVREAQLQMLRSQINPHFLFNSLNSISALTSIDTGAAREMTIALAQFFRQSLAFSERATIPLSQEIALCLSYLDVEKIRFGTKLQHEFQIDSAAHSAQIPPMILQPLIENAIKHGIRDLPEGGLILVQAVIRETWLYLSIRNPCETTSTATVNIGLGLGLTNIRQRLQNSYGNQSRLTWSKDKDGFYVEITLPLTAEK